jgi:hypothetical protein
MTSFVAKDDNGVATADFECFPIELGDSWIFTHKFKSGGLHSFFISMYHNQDFPAGTVISSPYMYHKYPDVYSVYSRPNEDGIYYGERASINPIHRGKKWWTWYGYMTRVIMWGTFGIHVDVTPDRNTKMESFYQKATKGIGQELKTKNNGRMNYPDEEMPRDPAFPYSWQNNRISKRIKNEN